MDGGQGRVADWRAGREKGTLFLPRACCIVSVSSPSGRETARRMEGGGERRCEREGPLSVIGNLYFCRPYLSSAFNPVLLYWVNRTNGSPRSSRSSDTMGRRGRGMLSICVVAGPRWPLWIATADDSNLPYNARVLRVPFASPPTMPNRGPIAELRPHFRRMSFARMRPRALYNRSLLPHRRIRLRDCFFHCRS